MVACDENGLECLRIRIVTFQTNPEDYNSPLADQRSSCKDIYSKRYVVRESDTVFSDESEASYFKRMVSQSSSLLTSQAFHS